MLRSIKRRYWISKMNWYLLIGQLNDMISRRLANAGSCDMISDLLDHAKRMTVAKYVIAAVYAARYIF